MELSLEKYVSGFNLVKATCNHGFFMMAPNHWVPDTKTLIRPLRLSENRSVVISILQSSPISLSLTILPGSHNTNEPLSLLDQKDIMDQVKRMLRLTEKEDKEVKEFHEVCPEAEKRGFGHLFRNPSLFEDIVKTLLLCHCNFERTLSMAEELCKIPHKLRNRKGGLKGSRVVKDTWGSFPTAQELASLKVTDYLIRKCNLGQRGPVILDFAKLVADGRINLLEFEEISDMKKLHRKLKVIKGFGDFVSANILMCIGFYQIIPQDSETIRHLREVHGRKDCTKTDVLIKQYDKYAPFQCLAYWMELVEYYETKLGKLSELERSSYKRVTGYVIDKGCS